MIKLKAPHRLILVFTTLLFCGCSAPVVGGPVASDPAIGTKIDAKSLLDFYPKLLAGIKYAYVSVEKKGQVEKSTRVEAEVLSADADKAKLRLTVGGSNAQVIDVNRAAPPVLPPGGITFEGREQLSVPAGNFNAQKFSYSQNNSSFNAWALQDIGILKVLEQRPNGDTVTTTMHSFTK